MRRVTSIILFVLGGWMLAGVGAIGLVPVEEGLSRWAVAAVVACFAAPFLLIGAWVSPGRRRAELGMTLMIAAGFAALVVITLAAVALDPAIQRYMQQPMPRFDFTSPVMITSLLLLGGGGYFLRRWGMQTGTPGSK